MSRRVLALLASSAVGLTFAVSGQLRAALADDEMAEAQRFVSRGAFEDSVAHWKKAEGLFGQAKNSSGQIEADVHLVAAYQALGQTNLAAATLMRAQKLTAAGD